MADPSPGCDKRTRLIRGAALLGLGLAFLLVRILYLQEPWNSDDFAYYDAARNIANGSHPLLSGELSTSKDPHTFRFGLLLPTALAIRLLGDNYLAYYVCPLLFSLAGFLVIFLLLRKYLPLAVVIAASCVHIVFPFEIRHGSILFTDLPSALLTLLVIVHLCWAAGKNLERRSFVLHAVLSGFLLFWSYLLRTNQLFVAAPAIAYLVCTKKTRKIVAIAVGVSLLLFLAEQALYCLQGGWFNYRWDLERGMVKSWMPFFNKVPWSEYPFRYFNFIKLDLGRFCLSFMCLSLIMHVVTFIKYRQTAVRALLLNGIFVFALFWYYIFKYSDGVLYVMNAQHRFIQLFYFTSLLAVPLGLHAVFQSLAKLVAGATETPWISKLTNRRYVTMCAALSVGFFVLPFVRVINVFNTNLASSKSNHNKLFKAINEKTGSGDRVTISGDTLWLRNVSLFKYPMIRKKVRWRAVSSEALPGMVLERSIRLLLIDRHRMRASLRYSANTPEGQNHKMRHRKLTLGLVKNYTVVHQSPRFSLFRLSDTRPTPIEFPNWNFGVKSASTVAPPGWWLSDLKNCKFLDWEKDRLTAQCKTRVGYLVSGSRVRFSKPSAIPKDYPLTAGGRYLIAVDVKRADKKINLEMWLVQYSASSRLGHRNKAIRLGENFMIVNTMAHASSFRILLRISGSGTFSIGSLRVSRL